MFPALGWLFYIKGFNSERQRRMSHWKRACGKKLVSVIFSSADLFLIVFFTITKNIINNRKWPSLAPIFILISGIGKDFKDRSNTWGQLLNFTLTLERNRRVSRQGYKSTWTHMYFLKRTKSNSHKKCHLLNLVYFVLRQNFT